MSKYGKWVKSWYEPTRYHWITKTKVREYLALYVNYVYLGKSWDNCFTLTEKGSLIADFVSFNEYMNDLFLFGYNSLHDAWGQYELIRKIDYGSTLYVNAVKSLNIILKRSMNHHVRHKCGPSPTENYVATLNKRKSEFDKKWITHLIKTISHEPISKKGVKSKSKRISSAIDTKGDVGEHNKGGYSI